MLLPPNQRTWIYSAVGALALMVVGGLLTLALAPSFSPTHKQAQKPHPFGVDANQIAAYGISFDERNSGKNPAKSAVLRSLEILHGVGWKQGETLSFPKEALIRIDSALGKWPKHPFLIYFRGRALEAMGNLVEAESSYQLSRSLSPQFAFPYIRLGKIAVAKGSWIHADNHFRMALSLWALDPAAYSGGEGAIPQLELSPDADLAWIFYQRGNVDSASLLLEYAEQNQGKDREADFLQGLIAEERGQLQKADSIYKALALQTPDPRFIEAMSTLGLKPPRGGLAPSAKSSAVFTISLLEPLAMRYPGNAPIRFALGQAYLRRGLYGSATAELDSVLRMDSSLSEARTMRDAAYRLWREEVANRPLDTLTVAKPTRNVHHDSGGEETVRVIVPGSTGMLGAYTVGWGATPSEVRKAYPGKMFINLPNGNLRESFAENGVVHDYVLAFRQGELWGVYVRITDTSTNSGDVFGRILRLKAKISGEGRGTGEMVCPGGKKFQGAIWENEDTFEFLAQFSGKEKEIRLARLAYNKLPNQRRVCDLEVFLQPQAWK